MAGIEDVIVQWAPGDPPFTADPDHETLPAAWQSIKIRSGQTIEEMVQTFKVGTATIKVRNGDSTGRTPTFLPGTSYRGINVRIQGAASVLFAGRIDRVEYDYTNTPFAGFVTLHCVDTLGSVSDAAIPDALFPDTVDYFTGVTDIETAFAAIMAQLNDVTLSVSGEFSHQLVKAPDKFETRQGLLEFLNEVLLTENATLFAVAGLSLQLRGRWEPLRLLAAGAAAPIVFTDTAPDGITTFGYRRDDLEWSDGDEDYLNSVQTRSKYLADTFVEANVVTGYPKIELSRTELATIRQGWVDANARMWFTLGNQSRAYPKKIKFMVASHGLDHPSMFSIAAPNLAFDQQFQVLHTPPGSTQITYRLAVDSIDHDIDRQRWQCTLGFTSLDRWWFGYGNGTDPIELIQIGGDSDHGIGSAAIIAP